MIFLKKKVAFKVKVFKKEKRGDILNDTLITRIIIKTFSEQTVA